jgi:threonine/homoserine/homoserine lactone efflux protein
MRKQKIDWTNPMVPCFCVFILLGTFNDTFLHAEWPLSLLLVGLTAITFWVLILYSSERELCRHLSARLQEIERKIDYQL